MVELEFKTQVPVSLQSELCTAVEYSCQGLDVKDIVSPLSALLAHKKLFTGGWHCYTTSAHDGEA